jgi:NAD(P)-dependent dehydrogenase (short-subunit alcohol dehydrogenase family)
MQLGDIVRPKFANPPIAANALVQRVAVVTGANSGIGLATARALAGAGARVVLACRNQQRAAAAAQDIARHVPGATTEIELVDLGTQSSVRATAAALAARFPRIDVLVNNAGVWSEYRRESADGIEQTWATNQLGPFALTALLLPQLKAAGGARIVNVASGLAHSLDLDDVEFRTRRYVGLNAYAQSKQANRMWTRALARRLAGTGVTVNAAHPGFTKTEQFARGGGIQSTIATLGNRLFGASAENGADSVVWLAGSAEVAGTTGRYVQDRKDVKDQWAEEASEERLYALCARMTSLDSDRRMS